MGYAAAMWMAAAVWLTSPAVGPAHAEVVDRILHVVGQRTVTVSDLAFEADLDPHDQSPVPAFEGPGLPLEQRLVDCALLREQAGDIDILKPSASDVQERWDRIREGWVPVGESAAFLARWGIDEEGVKGWLYSRMVVERFVLRSLAAPTAAAYLEWMAPIRARGVVRSPGQGDAFGAGP